MRERILDQLLRIKAEREEKLFEDADKRIDEAIAQKKHAPAPSPLWEKEYHETWAEHGDVTLYERRQHDQVFTAKGRREPNDQ